jgi:hypothetical protein
MDVSVLSSTSWAEGLGNVGDVDVDQSCCARGGARGGSYGGCIAQLFILGGMLAKMTWMNRRYNQQ